MNLSNFKALLWAFLLVWNWNAFAVNPDPAITVNSIGNVGIGTKTPESKLDVKGNVRIVGNTQGSQNIPSLVISTPQSLVGPVIRFASTGDPNYYLTLSAYQPVPYNYIGWTFDLTSYHGGASSLLTLDPRTPPSQKQPGMVGINTRDPKATLDVNGSVSISGNLTALDIKTNASPIYTYINDTTWNPFAAVAGNERIACYVNNNGGSLVVLNPTHAGSLLSVGDRLCTIGEHNKCIQGSITIITSIEENTPQRLAVHTQKKMYNCSENWQINDIKISRNPLKEIVYKDSLPSIVIRDKEGTPMLKVVGDKLFVRQICNIANNQCRSL